jgi:farnesyl-diphosphate farnesyltransferase
LLVKPLAEVLTRTSRTFGLTIPYLPQPLRHEITLAYLLFRIADTLEDAPNWPIPKRVAALSEFHDFLLEPNSIDAISHSLAWCDPAPCDSVEYLELLGMLPQVIGELESLPAETTAIIYPHARRTIVGMRECLEQPPQDLFSLRKYCYYVAGIVGELLTELFILGLKLNAEQTPRLRELATQFGEGLQLVNILKDADVDAREGRQFLPKQLDRRLVFELVRRNLTAAEEYTQQLHASGAPCGVVTFTGMTTALAHATLDLIETQGAGAKLTRPEVEAIRQRIEAWVKAGLQPPANNPAESSS